jgi:hypothetical protein
MVTEELQADFPTLTRDSARAIIGLAAVSAEEDLPAPGASVA